MASIAAMRAQRRSAASFRGVSIIASNAAMRAQRRTVASFRENFKLPARLWEQREVLRCVDLHCGGEPATVVFGGGGVADAPGATMFAKRAHVMERMDRWREVLLHEPRGYPCSNADYLVEPTLAGADAGFVIAEQAKIYPLMSGHNTICVATALVECGLLPADRRERFVLEAPSGPVPVEADVAEDGRCRSITFQGPPSFVAVRDEVVQLDPDACRALGLAAAEVRIDVAYGGMWYAIADAPTGAEFNAVAATPYADGVGVPAGRGPRPRDRREGRRAAAGRGRARQGRRARAVPRAAPYLRLSRSRHHGLPGALAPRRRRDEHGRHVQRLLGHAG